MVLNNDHHTINGLRQGLMILLLLPLFAKAQPSLQMATGAVTAKLVETEPVTIKAATDNKIDASLRAEGKTFILQLSGTGKFAHTINSEDPVILLLENDSTVTLKATAVQGYNDMDSVRTFRHEYAIMQPDLEMLSRSRIQALRKYSVIGFDDIYPDANATARLQALFLSFLQKLYKENLLKKVVITEPSFPGGRDMLLSFVNRNLKQLPFLRAGEEKTAIVQFRVEPDGSMQQLEVKQPAGTVFDNELLRILKRMPRWKPALADGQPVDRTVTLRVTYYQDAEKIKLKF